MSKTILKKGTQKKKAVAVFGDMAEGSVKDLKAQSGILTQNIPQKEEGKTSSKKKESVR